MELILEPEIGVPYSDKIPYLDLRARVEAACNTATMLSEHGLDLTPSTEDEVLASSLAVAYADNPEKLLGRSHTSVQPSCHPLRSLLRIKSSPISAML